MDAYAVRGAGVGSISSREHGNMRGFQLRNRLLSILLTQCGGKLRKRLLQIPYIVSCEVELKPGIRCERLAARAADALEHAESRDDKGVMSGHEFAEVGCGSTVRKQMR